MAFTFFFRDLPTLNGIRNHVIPKLKDNQYINVWDAGCAMGPEPYSLAIIFRENLSFYYRAGIIPVNLKTNSMKAGQQ